MRAAGVVVQTPAFEDPASLGQAAEQVLVQTFIAQAPDEALCEAVLQWLARAAPD
jgi:hypothetical protein